MIEIRINFVLMKKCIMYVKKSIIMTLKNKYLGTFLS
jgi:hypothetical protein